MNSKSSNNGASPLPDPPDAAEIVLARLGRPRGLKGEIWLNVETDRPEQVLSRVGSYRLRDGRAIPVEELRAVGGGWTWVIQGRPAREDVAQWTNGVVVVLASELPPRPEGEYSVHELIGIDVVDTNGHRHGRIVRVDHRYEVDTWIVLDDHRREGEIAAIAANILDVDLTRRIVTVAPDAVMSTAE